MVDRASAEAAGTVLRTSVAGQAARDTDRDAGVGEFASLELEEWPVKLEESG